MNFCVKIFFALFLFGFASRAQTDSFTKIITPISLKAFYQNFNPLPSHMPEVDVKRTDSLQNCDFCKKKREEFYSLKQKLNKSFDSANKIIDYHNTYIKDGYYYYLSFKEDEKSAFNWEGCTSFFYNGNLVLEKTIYCMYSYNSYEETSDVIHVNLKIVKEQYFKWRLDGLTGEHRFYQEDLR